MTDIADIGFRADTSGLDAAKTSLDALSPSAAKAEKASSKLSQTFDNANAASAKLMSAADALSSVCGKLVSSLTASSNATIKSASSAVTASSANDKLASSNQRLGISVDLATSKLRAMQTVMASQFNDARNRGSDIAAYGNSLDDLRAKFNPLYAIIRQYKNNIAEIRQANAVGAISADEMSEALIRQRQAALTAIGAIKQNSKALIAYSRGASNFNTANIAAQFQDIAVTAQMGMNPMQIALQQGTQLSAVLAMMDKPLDGIAQGFKQIFSPASLLVIVLIGLVAAGIQLVDWTKVAKSSLYALAEAIKVVGPYAIGLSVALALLYAPSIVSGIITVIALISRMGIAALVAAADFTVAWLAALGPIGWIIVGIAGITAALVLFGKQINQIFGFDLTGSVKTGVNYIIGAFVGAYNGVEKTWKMLPDVIGDLTIRTSNYVISKVAKTVNTAIDYVNGLIGKLPAWIGRNTKIDFKLPTGDALANPFNKNAKSAADLFIGEIGKAQNYDYLKKAGQAVISGVAKASASITKFADGLNFDAKKKGKTDVEKYADIINEANQKINSMAAKNAGFGLDAEAAAKLTYETDLLNKAADKNLKLTAAQRGELSNLAAQMAKLDVQGQKDQLFSGSEKTLKGLKDQYDAIGLNATATAQLRYENDLLNQATEKHITLTDAEKSRIHNLAGEMASYEVSIQKSTDALNFAKDATKGFVSDLYTGLREGKSLWETFGSAVGTVIDKIIDKLLNQLVDAIFQVNSAGSSSGVGGFLVSASKWVGSLFANGAAFNGGVQKFAKGGDFTNKIASRPTLFSFANGTALGQMGEAGPEAIMPLHRGADGSLGVRMARNDNASSGAIYAPNVNMTVTVNNGQADAKTQTDNNDARQLADSLNDAVLDVLDREFRQGGRLWKVSR